MSSLPHDLGRPRRGRDRSPRGPCLRGGESGPWLTRGTSERSSPSPAAGSVVDDRLVSVGRVVGCSGRDEVVGSATGSPRVQAARIEKMVRTPMKQIDRRGGRLATVDPSTPDGHRWFPWPEVLRFTRNAAISGRRPPLRPGCPRRSSRDAGRSRRGRGRPGSRPTPAQP